MKLIIKVTLLILCFVFVAISACQKGGSCNEITVQISVPKETDTVYKFDSIVLAGECSLPYAKTYWLDNNGVKIFNSNLKISNVMLSDAGKYQFVATYADCIASKSFTLKVEEHFIDSSCVSLNTFNRGQVQYSVYSVVKKYDYYNDPYLLVSISGSQKLEIYFPAPIDYLEGRYQFGLGGSQNFVKLSYYSGGSYLFPSSPYGYINVTQYKGWLYVNICDLSVYYPSTNQKSTISASFRYLL